MKYTDGQEVLIGDRVIADDSPGQVVAVLDTKQFSDQYPEDGVIRKTELSSKPRRGG